MTIKEIDDTIKSLTKMKAELEAQCKFKVGDKVDVQGKDTVFTVTRVAHATELFITDNHWNIHVDYSCSTNIDMLTKHDPLKELKKAYSEGAIIEFKTKVIGNWVVSTLQWDIDYEYRIKGGISIASWDMHKDLIKQYWDGVEIEIWYGGNTWDKVTPTWMVTSTYRVKQDKWKLPEYEDGSKYIIEGTGNIAKTSVGIFTKAGRRRATKELAEICAKNSKTRDTLEAHVHRIDPDAKGGSYVINKDRKGKYYCCQAIGYYGIIGAVYSSEETMEEIVDALNKGEIVL